MKQFINIFGFHFKESAMSKAAIISMAVTFVVTVGIFGGIYWFIQSQDEAKIVVIQNSENFVLDESSLNETLEDVDFTFEPYSRLDELRDDLENGDIDTIFIIAGNEIPEITSIHENTSHFESEMVILQALQQQYLGRVMGENEVSAEVVEQLLNPLVVDNEPLRDQEEAMVGSAIAQAFGWGLYMILIICGQVVANGIVSEKSSRVMEVMISKVKPIYMMYAKILVALTNIFALVLPVIAGAVIADFLGWFAISEILDLLASLNLDGRTLVLGLVFLVLGYLLYSLLYAAAGAMCSNAEMLATVTSPLTMAIVIPFILPLMLPSESIIMTVMSYIPFFSPFVTFNRFASGIAGTIEVGIVIAIMIVTIMVLGKLATRVYINGVMRYSEKVTFKDVIQLLQRQ